MTTHNPELPAAKTPKVGITIAGLLLAAVVAGGGFMYAAISNVVDAIPTPQDFSEALAPQPYEQVSATVITSIQEMAELTTVEMTEYTIVEKGTDAGWLDWARGDTVRLMAVADIGAGVDLTLLTSDDFSVSEEGVVEVTAPEASIHYVAIDHEATQILERDKGIFTKGDPRLESEARLVAETTLTKAALEKGILAEAEASARTALTSMLLGLGYTDVIVTFS